MQSDLEFFLSNVDQYKFTDMCWLWTANKNTWGYGLFGRSRAYRWIYACLFGSIPSKHAIHHTCYNKLCVNPCHLKCMSVSAHRLLHGKDNGRTNKTHCKRGHKFTEENTRVTKTPIGNSGRACKECERLRERKSKKSTQIPRTTFISGWYPGKLLVEKHRLK